MASRRGYLTIPELEEFADITVTNETEAFDQMSQAEELLDAYVGYQDRHVRAEKRGKLTSVVSTTLFDTSSDTPLNVDDNYYTFCLVEIIAGTGAGQNRLISSSNKNNKSITIASAFTVSPDSSSIYRIFQLGKFPRFQDIYHEPETLTYYKYIPEAIKRATAAQMQFMIEKGNAFFSGDDSDKMAESFGNYSYSKGGSGSKSASIVNLIAPKAKALLKGITNRTGTLIADNPTRL